MKKIIFASLLSLSFLFLGCDEGANDGRFEPNSRSGWVQFNSESTLLSGDCQDGLSIPVSLKVPINDEGVLVSYSISDVTGSLASQVNSSGSVLIPAGSREGVIVLDFSDDIGLLGDFLITLEATNRAGVEIGLSDNSKPVTHLVSINSRDFLLGTYEVVEDDQWEYEVELIAGEAANEITIVGLYGVDSASETTVFVNHETGTLTFAPMLDNFLFVDSNVGALYVNGLTPNTFDCNGGINLNFELRYGPTQMGTTGSINAVLTRTTE